MRGGGGVFEPMYNNSMHVSTIYFILFYFISEFSNGKSFI